jgi:hypothetical protein
MGKLRAVPSTRVASLKRGALQRRAAFNGDQPTIGDRVVASVPYLIPLLDALPFGKFIFLQYPFIARALSPLGPLNQIYNGIPFAPLIIFFAVYSGIVNNQNLSRFVRYNAAQAVVLDILLILPQVILNTLFKQPEDGIPLQMYMSTYNTVFLFVAVCSAYGIASCAVGQSPRLPLVADAADSQVRGGM